MQFFYCAVVVSTCDQADASRQAGLVFASLGLSIAHLAYCMKCPALGRTAGGLTVPTRYLTFAGSSTCVSTFHNNKKKSTAMHGSNIGQWKRANGKTSIFHKVSGM